MPRSITDGNIKIVCRDLEGRVNLAMLKHGDAPFASPHEAYGVLAEEMAELLEAIKSNDVMAIERECIDVAVAAIFACASADVGFSRTR